MRTDLLDHGYIELVESWGSDERIIEAARMSTNKGFLGWGPVECSCKGMLLLIACSKCEGTHKVPGDEKLLRYLWENKHTGPFEFCGLTIEIQAPIFVMREWIRHRTQSQLDDESEGLILDNFSINEMSARYTPLPNLNYIPTVERLMMGSDGKNKQAGTAKDAKPLTEMNAKLFREMLSQTYREQQRIYEDALQHGVPKELARIHLPVGRYSRMRASANLLNWLKFLSLRMHPTAQWEIRQFANSLGTFVEKLFPRTWSLFAEKMDAR